MQKIRKGDEVMVITGKDKGRTGTVLEVLTDEDRLLVEGINIARKHIKPNPNVGEPGGIKDKAMPIHRSNVQVYNPKSKKGDRVGIEIGKDGKKTRIFRSTKEAVDV
ncbi:MAG: 50S ribosomal protein L24 [Pseudomonadota bacterium]